MSKKYGRVAHHRRVYYPRRFVLESITCCDCGCVLPKGARRLGLCQRCVAEQHARGGMPHITHSA